MIGLTAKKVEAEKRNMSLASPEILDLFEPSSKSTSGVTVTTKTSLTSTAVWSCVKVISETIASLPLNTYKRTSNGKIKAKDYPLFDLLKYAPNNEMTAMSFWELALVNLLLKGNFYAEKDYGNYGFRPLALYPLQADMVAPYRSDGGELRYKIYTFSGKILDWGKDKIFHIPGMGFNGIVGLSAIAHFRQSIGLALAAEEFGSQFFGNGARPGGVLEHPAKLGDKAFDRLEKSFNNRHQGLANAQKLSILEEGMKYHALQVAPNDAQFLQTREYQTVDIARIFNVPPEMIGVATKSNIKQEDLSIKFVTYTLRPWLVRIESAIRNQIFGVKERKLYLAEFNANALLRGDFKSRQEGFAIARQNGWLSADDIRAMENLNPLPKGQGKLHIVPMNYIPLNKMEELAQAQIDKAKEGTQDNPGSPKQALSDDLDGSPSAKRDLAPLQKDIASGIIKRYGTDKASGHLKLNRFRKFVEDRTRSYCEFVGIKHDTTVDILIRCLQQKDNCSVNDLMTELGEKND